MKSRKVHSSTSPRPKGAQTPMLPRGKKVPTRSGVFKSFDGAEIFYCVEGEGPPLLFFYGLVCSSLHWTYQIEELSQHYQCIWFDYRGHEHSPVPSDLRSLTLENSGKDGKALLDFLNIKEVVTLGHSMGVNVALYHWALDQKRVKGMVLANGTVRPPFESLGGHHAIEKAFQFLRSTDEKTSILSRIWKFSKNNLLLKTAVALGGFNPSLIAWEDVRTYINKITELPPEVFLQILEDYTKANQAGLLSEIHCPVFVLAGEKDHVVPIDHQRLLHQLIKGSDFDIIRHASHCPQLELPEQVNLRLQKFFDEIGWKAAAHDKTKDAAHPKEIA